MDGYSSLNYMTSIVSMTTRVFVQAVASLLLLAQSLLAQESQVNLLYRQPQDGRRIADMIELPSYPREKGGFLVFHKGYTVFYSSRYGVPLWVAWEINPGRVRGVESRAGYGFFPDPALPDSLQTNQNEYNRSGYDKGHMCPANDNTGSAELMQECHYALNLAPQRKGLNRSGGTWFNVEQECTKFVKREGKKLYVVCGPIIEHSTLSVRQRLNGRSAYIPKRFFKVIMYEDEGMRYGMALIFNQWNNMKAKTIRDVEAIVGFNFFKNLPEKEQSKFETIVGDNVLFRTIKRNARIE